MEEVKQQEYFDSVDTLQEYKTFLETLGQSQGVNINTEYQDDKFVDATIQFGYLVYYLERQRMCRVLDKIIVEIDEQLTLAYDNGYETGYFSGACSNVQ